MSNDNTPLLNHNDLVKLLFEAVSRGDFGDNTEVAGLFSGRADNPIQVALRDLDSQTVSLVNLNRDGSMTVDLRDRPVRAA